VEAVVPRFFKGGTDGYFIGKYFSAERCAAPDIENRSMPAPKDDEGAVCKRHRTAGSAANITVCTPSDVVEMSRIYRQVFRSYPFPIQEPAYLMRVIKEGVPYFCVRMEGNIAAIAAAEIDPANKNAEMTDFATLPKWRGRGLAGKLLRHMDGKARKLGVKTAYTIARAASPGINAIFKNGGYTYAGLLPNNSQISGNIQSMTVWYKHL
jgi:putative beta-lysine N-acetyltransferase